MKRIILWFMLSGVSFAQGIFCASGVNCAYTGNNTHSGSETFSGSTTVPTPTSPSQAATKAYVDSSTGAALPLAGGTLTGPLNGTSANFSGSVAAGMTVSGPDIYSSAWPKMDANSPAYGCVGDGVTDNLPCMTTALGATNATVPGLASTNLTSRYTLGTYANAIGTEIDFAPGVYWFSASIHVNGIVHIKGMGVGWTRYSPVMFIFPDGVTPFVFEGYSTADSCLTSGGCNGMRADNSIIEGVQIIQKSYSGTWTAGSTTMTGLNCTNHPNGTPLFGYGLASGTTVTNCSTGTISPVPLLSSVASGVENYFWVADSGAGISCSTTIGSNLAYGCASDPSRYFNEGDPVYSTNFPSQQIQYLLWTANTSYANGALVSGNAFNGHYYAQTSGGTCESGQKIYAGQNFPITSAGVLTETPFWKFSQAYATGTIVIPNPVNGHVYEATTGGTSSTTAPTWPTTGGTVTDGSVTWTDEGLSSGNPLICKWTEQGAAELETTASNINMSWITSRSGIATGTAITPVTQNGHFYTNLGSTCASGATEPTWPTGSGATVGDNTCTWTESGAGPIIQMALPATATGTTTLFNGPPDGIRSRVPIIVERTSIEHVAGDGVHVVADVTGHVARLDGVQSQTGPQASGVQLLDLRIESGGGDGFIFNGGDSNNSYTKDVQCATNGGFCWDDRGFLGSYHEADGANAQAKGCARGDNANAHGTTFKEEYCEGGIPPNFLQTPSVIEGGNNMANTIGTGLVTVDSNTPSGASGANGPLPSYTNARGPISTYTSLSCDVAGCVDYFTATDSPAILAYRFQYGFNQPGWWEMDYGQVSTYMPYELSTANSNNVRETPAEGQIRFPNGYYIGAAANSRKVLSPASAAPTSGTYIAGDFAPNLTGSTYGWICTAGGTPGTWVAVGPAITALTNDVSASGSGSTIATVLGIQNKAVAAPTTAGYLHWNGSAWVYDNPAGSGTVTNSTGVLTAIDPVIGNGGGDIKTVGPLFPRNACAPVVAASAITGTGAAQTLATCTIPATLFSTGSIPASGYLDCKWQLIHASNNTAITVGLQFNSNSVISWSSVTPAATAKATSAFRAYANSGQSSLYVVSEVIQVAGVSPTNVIATGTTQSAATTGTLTVNLTGNFAATDTYSVNEFSCRVWPQ